jgi:hypothetical protein
MPKYLDFDTTKDFRDKMLNRTLNPVYGRSPSPKTFTSSNYSNQTLGDSPNLLLPQVDGNRKNDLSVPQKSNIFKPTEYFVKDTIEDLPRRANLSLYPYFTKSDDNLIGIMLTKNYDTESELFKFASKYIRTDTNGPVLARINQNLYTATNAKNKIGEALGGNTTTLINIIRGKEPLIEGNNKITVSSSLIGKGIDFLGSVAGTQLPFSTIPGDYLTNPRNPVNLRPTDVSTGTKVWQDLTGVLGSIVGIQRRPLPSRKPSDILIEHMGSSSKNRLFDLLSLSKYSPNYTTSARSQMSTGLGRIPSQVAQGVKSLLGMEAPNNGAYIGDDRENNVKNQTTDLFSGRPIRSSYYLTLMYDKVAAELFHNTKSIIEDGPIGGNLTWISKNRIDNSDITSLNKTKSTDFNFRTDSILETTQQILDSKPQNGGDALAHIGHVLDQTSKYFKDGDTYISRGSGVRYMDNSGKDIGIEYARVWTKNRPYLKYGDTMPLYKETIETPYYKGGETPFRRTGIRKFDGSVMTNTWNLNIAPMSDGTSNREFPNSSNIVKGEKGFYAKKYMLSIENLAWASSTLPGFTVNDLPYSERGPNGGRVMWFPPYDLKVSEQNSAKWEPNTFLGRPEPIYTYQNSERNGSISFKVIVDHPSILNLLVREHFKSVNEKDVDAYINAFFAGAKDIDFYSLIRQYSHLDSDDIKMIQNYLGNGGDPSDIKRFQTGVSTVVKDNPDGTSTQDANKETVIKKVKLIFQNDEPGKGDSSKSDSDYGGLLIAINKTENETKLRSALTKIITGTTPSDLLDCVSVFGKDRIENSESGSTINKVATDLQTIFTTNDTANSEMISTLNTLQKDLENKNVTGDVVVLINSTTSKAGEEKANYQLSVRRSHSIYSTVFNKLNKKGTPSKWDFKKLDSQSFPDGMEVYVYENQYSFIDLGYEGQTGNLIIRTTNYGYKANMDNVDCSKVLYNNKDLIKFTPLSYGCRASVFSVEYDKTKKIDTPINGSVNTKLNPMGVISTNKPKPTIDVMKRIIMKTLSEEFYFKKLEESSPMIYSSLKEKLKYFHPGFHSMTPEGLNSRLTFLQQCLRPGDTIPVKGLSDNSDINARNTTFGPPPVCVLRVGDFYNSKVIIKDLNIQFEQNVWDLNPEGIGIQPMIADVTMQLSFLGGQGLEKPVERLQNALSSNFFANTEMYDERAITTNTKMGGKDTSDFTKEFIQSLSDQYIPKPALKDTKGKGPIEGQYIGTLSSTDLTLTYTTLVDELYNKTDTYFTSYQNLYNNILTSYGPILTNLILNKDYRSLNEYDVYTGNTTVDTINLFGLFKDVTLPTYVTELTTLLTAYMSNQFYTVNDKYIIEFFNLKSVIPNKYESGISEIIHNNIQNILPIKLNEINELKSIKEFEVKRNELIQTLDKLNFITKYAYDVKVDKNKASKITLGLGDFDKNNFYSNYSGCVDYIKNNTEKMYNKLNTSLNFSNLVKNKDYSEITENSAKNIFNPLLYDKIDDILVGIEVVLPSEDYSLTDKIKDKLKSVFSKTKEENLKFSKSPIRKNNNPIVYKFPPFDLSEENIDMTDEIKALLSSKNNVTEKLNYFRI